MEEFETSAHTKELDVIYEKPTEEIEDVVFNDADLMHEFKTKYRLVRKSISAFIRQKMKKDFRDILIITPNKLPIDFILAFEKQYPDKKIKILMPVDNIGGVEKMHFEFYLQNRMNSATVYTLPKTRENVEIYGLYSTAFSGNDRTRLQFLAPFIKAARICAPKLKPEIIQVNGIPFFLGMEFENKRSYPIKVFQIINDFGEFEANKVETFWAAINLVNKKGMKKICNDKIIKKCIAALFNLHNTKRFYQMRECLEFIYQNYFKFRKFIDKCEDIDENILFNRMNSRILKLFPQMAYADEVYYNTMLLSVKKADFWATYSKTYYREIFKNPQITGKMSKYLDKAKSGYVSFGLTPVNTNLYQHFDVNNFRELRSRNKNYLLKEFSEERIRTRFVDIGLFKDENYTIRGYLDSFYDSPLIFGTFSDEVFAQGVDIAFNTILKLFEEHKNLQFIINIPNGLANNYVKSWVEFMEKSSAFNGRWLFIDGEINLAQFCAASDMILLPKRANIVTPEHYIAMKYGCVPIAARSGIFNDTIADIFDDITFGCGFKTKTPLLIEDDANEIYRAVILKALNLFTKNPASWNLLIKNAMSYDSSWNFGIIEKYNEIYENL